MSLTHFPPLMWMPQSCIGNGKIQKEKTKSMKTSLGKQPYIVVCHFFRVEFKIVNHTNRSQAQVSWGF